MSKDIEKTIAQIKKSYPLIKNKKIQIKYFSSDNYSGGAFWILPFWRVLFLNKNRNFNSSEWTGLIAHELAHFEIDQERGWLKTFIIGIFYWLSPKLRKSEETKVDKKAIEAGYTKEIYALAKKLKNKKIRGYYMKPEEIKSYTREIGKW